MEEQEEGATVGPVYAAYYPKAMFSLLEVSRNGIEEKEESWWLVIGGPKSALAGALRASQKEKSVLNRWRSSASPSTRPRRT